MLRNILFIQAMLVHIDEIKTLLGDEWNTVKGELFSLLAELANEMDQQKISARVNRIYRSLWNTPAETLVRKLFQQAAEQAQQNIPATRSIRYADPTTGKSKSFEIPKSTLDEIDRDVSHIKVIAKEIGHVIGEQIAELQPEPVPSIASEVQKVSTHPNLLGDDYSYLNKPYYFTIKLSDQPQPGGPYISVPELEIPVDEGELVKKILVRLTAPDFDLEPSESALGWMREIDFYPNAAASSAITFTLRPQDRFEERYFALLRVQFISNGQVLGNAIRRVEVLQKDAVAKTPFSAFPPAPGYPLDERGEVKVDPVATPVTFRSEEPDVHLTITISITDDRGRLLWEVDSPFLESKDFPEDEYFSRNLGIEEFVKEYLAPFGMPGNWPEDHMDNSGCLKDLSINILLNNLLTLRRSAPAPFWTLYKLVLERYLAQGRKSEDFAILFITADTHIPWELMPVSENADSDTILLLGSAHQVGRWLLGTGTPIPDSKLDLYGFSLVAPKYSGNPLPQAQIEKEFIEKHYQPYVLPDNPEEFIKFMKTGQPTDGTGILHFAGHGDCCTDKMRRNWLELTNRQALYDINSASIDRGNKLGKLRPIVAFFNACNVGRAAPGPLGSNGGWGRALLNQQYKGYIGPLWSVYDQHARDICQMFYTLALDEALSLGEVMRRIRYRFSEDNRLFTYLAYLYLGHPFAKIKYTPFEGLNT